METGRTHGAFKLYGYVRLANNTTGRPPERKAKIPGLPPERFAKLALPKNFLALAWMLDVRGVISTYESIQEPGIRCETGDRVT
jgi:hypothetical protein